MVAELDVIHGHLSQLMRRQEGERERARTMGRPRRLLQARHRTRMRTS